MLRKWQLATDEKRTASCIKMEIGLKILFQAIKVVGGF